MPTVTVAVPYDVALDPVEVKKKTGPMLRARLQEYQIDDFQIEWTEMTAKYQFTGHGFLVQGTVDIQPNQIVVDVQLPWLATMFKDRIRKGIAAGIAEALDATPQ